MSEISHAGGENHARDGSHGAHSGDVAHEAIHGEGAHGDAVHGGHPHDTPLGPIDWPAWGAGLLGIATGLVVAACLYITTSF